MADNPYAPGAGIYGPSQEQLTGILGALQPGLNQQPPTAGLSGFESKKTNVAALGVSLLQGLQRARMRQFLTSEVEKDRQFKEVLAGYQNILQRAVPGTPEYQNIQGEMDKWMRAHVLGQLNESDTGPMSGAGSSSKGGAKKASSVGAGTDASGGKRGKGEMSVGDHIKGILTHVIKGATPTPPETPIGDVNSALANITRLGNTIPVPTQQVDKGRQMAQDAINRIKRDNPNASEDDIYNDKAFKDGIALIRTYGGQNAESHIQDITRGMLGWAEAGMKGAAKYGEQLLGNEPPDARETGQPGQPGAWQRTPSIMSPSGPVPLGGQRFQRTPDIMTPSGPVPLGGNPPPVREEEANRALVERQGYAERPAPEPPGASPPNFPRVPGGTNAPLFMAPGPTVGMLKPGNIDLKTLPPVDLGSGKWGTVNSASRGVNGQEILYPTIVNGKQLSDDEAFAYAMRTGKNLGVFKDGAAADAYAQRLHSDWESGRIPGTMMRPEDMQQLAQTVTIPRIAPGQPGIEQQAYKNNNPMNLKFANQPGATLGYKGGAKFKTALDGYISNLHQIDINAKEGLTLDQHLRKWTQGEPKEVQDQYIANVRSKLKNVDPNQPISQIDRNALAGAQAFSDSGTTVSYAMQQQANQQLAESQEAPQAPARTPAGTPYRIPYKGRLNIDGFTTEYFVKYYHFQPGQVFYLSDGRGEVIPVKQVTPDVNPRYVDMANPGMEIDVRKMVNEGWQFRADKPPDRNLEKPTYYMSDAPANADGSGQNTKKYAWWYVDPIDGVKKWRTRPDGTIDMRDKPPDRYEEDKKQAEGKIMATFQRYDTQLKDLELKYNGWIAAAQRSPNMPHALYQKDNDNSGVKKGQAMPGPEAPVNTIEHEVYRLQQEYLQLKKTLEDKREQEVTGQAYLWSLQGQLDKIRAGMEAGQGTLGVMLDGPEPQQ